MTQEKIIFYKNLKTKKPSVALIFAKYKNEWLFCKHKERDTWEICGGHVENNEELLDCAKRELFEESGAIAKEMNLVGYYSFYVDNKRNYGALFTAEIEEIKELSDFEMKEIRLFEQFPSDTTYPNTYKKLMSKIYF